MDRRAGSGKGTEMTMSTAGGKKYRGNVQKWNLELLKRGEGVDLGPRLRGINI